MPGASWRPECLQERSFLHQADELRTFAIRIRSQRTLGTIQSCGKGSAFLVNGALQKQRTFRHAAGKAPVRTWLRAEDVFRGHGGF